MDDDITPGETRWLADGPDKDAWDMQIFSDEVFWRCPQEVENENCNYHRVARFPFVPGYFACKLVGHLVHYPVAGPFPTLKSAKAAVLLLGEIHEED